MCFSAMQAKISGEEIYQSEFLNFNKIKIFDFDAKIHPKVPQQDDRFFPKWWTHLLRQVGPDLEFRPMRYQLLPHFCPDPVYKALNARTRKQVEIQTFNARMDGLEKRHAWKNIFGKQHGIVPIKAFYEWVLDGKKKRLIEFSASDDSILWAACLWDTWKGHGTQIDSFAMITTDPHEDVLAKGHDRTPVFLKDSVLEYWLKPENESKDELFEILNQQKQLSFKWKWA